MAHRFKVVQGGPRTHSVPLIRIAVAITVLTAIAGCARHYDAAGVEERTGVRLPLAAKNLQAMTEGGHDPATYVRAELSPRDVKPFLASLPAGSKVLRRDNPWGGFDGAPPWWDATGPTRCIYITAPDAGYGDVDVMISQDDPQHPVLYVFSMRGMR